MRYFRAIFFCSAIMVSGFSNPWAHAAEKEAMPNEFTFVQLSDTHWGFNDTKVNPDHAGTLRKVIAAVNELFPQPDFLIFTGDLTQTTDDPQERRKRLAEFRDFAAKLHVKDVRYMPGEHDAGLDHGEAYKEFFGETYYTFEHKGVHCIVLDNVSDPTSSLGETQLQWLREDLKKIASDAKIVVFTHRPLFDLYPQWDWWTRDGAKAIELLAPFKNVTVFYGHIHQENHYTAGSITFHAAKGLMYPLPAPGSVPKKAPILWDPATPWKGLGFRGALVKVDAGSYQLTEYPIPGSVEEKVPTTVPATSPQAISVPVAKDPEEKVIKMTAKKYEYFPREITIKKGVPVVLELTSLDRLHGFNCPELKVRADVEPGKVSKVRILAEKTGTYDFFL